MYSFSIRQFVRRHIGLDFFQRPPANVWPKLYFDALNVWGGFINSTSTLYIYICIEPILYIYIIYIYIYIHRNLKLQRWNIQAGPCFDVAGSRVKTGSSCLQVTTRFQLLRTNGRYRANSIAKGQLAVLSTIAIGASWCILKRHRQAQVLRAKPWVQQSGFTLMLCGKVFIYSYNL